MYILNFKKVLVFVLVVLEVEICFVFINVEEIFDNFVVLRIFFMFDLRVIVVFFVDFDFVGCEVIFFWVFWVCVFICVLIVMKYLLCYFRLIFIVKVLCVFVGSMWNVVVKGGFFLRLNFLLVIDLI